MFHIISLFFSFPLIEELGDIIAAAVIDDIDLLTVSLSYVCASSDDGELPSYRVQFVGHDPVCIGRRPRVHGWFTTDNIDNCECKITM